MKGYPPGLWVLWDGEKPRGPKAPHNLCRESGIIQVIPLELRRLPVRDWLPRSGSNRAAAPLVLKGHWVEPPGAADCQSAATNRSRI